MRRTGFTLIELLVVISIIALLSSVVLAQLNSAREKGRLAAGKQFDANMYHATADAAVGIWDLDECSGTAVTDRSGNGNDGTFVGSPAWSTDTPTGKGCSLQFSSGKYVSLSSNNLPTGSAARTISTWINIISVYATENDFIDWGGSGSYTQFGLFTPASAPDRWGMHFGGTDYTSNTPITYGVWHHLAITYDGTVAKLYLDGSLIGSTAVALNTSAGNLFFGKHIVSGFYFNGSLDSIRIYAKDLSASEVGKMYAEGLPAHSLASAADAR